MPLGAATLGKEALFPKSAVSLVSVGDGSVNNAMFLAAVNMAEYARFRGRKCPVLFAVTDNQLCISLKGHGWHAPSTPQNRPCTHDQPHALAYRGRVHMRA